MRGFSTAPKGLVGWGDDPAHDDKSSLGRSSTALDEGLFGSRGGSDKGKKADKAKEEGKKSGDDKGRK